MARLIVRVKCPWCGEEFNTSKFKYLVCPNCFRRFNVYYKKKGKVTHFIVSIVKGTRSQLFRIYSKIFRRPVTI
jgi:uncharacterized OB-fold protein